MQKPSFKIREEGRGSHLSDYWPLIALILVSGAVATALSWRAGFPMNLWMHDFMGFFLCVFALLKLFHLSAFADGFQMYDLLAKPFRPYAYLYPFLELALGMGYFAFFELRYLYSATIALFLFGALGVILALRKGLDINCPCMGTILKVPLSTVTLTEDLAMTAMAGYMLVQMS